MDAKAGDPPDSTTLSAFVVLVLIGGVNVVAVRLSNRELAPFFGAAIRFVVASVLLFAYVGARRLPLPRGQSLVGTVLYGVLGIGGAFGFAYWALQSLSAGVAAVIMASIPLLTLLFATMHRLGEFRTRGLVGAVVAIGGIAVLLAGPGDTTITFPSLLSMLGAAVCMAESSVLIKRFPPSDPAATNAVAMGIGALFLFLLSAGANEAWLVPHSRATWVSLGYLIGVGSLGMFGLYLFTLGRWTATGVSYMFVLFPIVASIAGALLANEPITGRVVIGGLIVLAGVYVGALSGHRKTGSPVAAPEGCVPAREEAVV